MLETVRGPRQLIVGEGVAQNIPRVVAECGKRVLIVTDRVLLGQPGVARLMAETDWANPASVRVLSKAGFTPAGAATEPSGARFHPGRAPPGGARRSAGRRSRCPPWPSGTRTRSGPGVPAASRPRPGDGRRRHRGPGGSAVSASASVSAARARSSASGAPSRASTINTFTWTTAPSCREKGTVMPQLVRRFAAIGFAGAEQRWGPVPDDPNGGAGGAPVGGVRPPPVVSTPPGWYAGGGD